MSTTTERGNGVKPIERVLEICKRFQVFDTIKKEAEEAEALDKKDFAENFNDLAPNILHLQPEPPEDDLVTDWLAKTDGALLIAPSGVGKSSFTTQFCIYLACGEPFFGIIPVRPVKILYIQAENRKRVVCRQRDSVLKYALPQNINFDPLANGGLRVVRMNYAAGDQFVDELHKILKIEPFDLVVVDPLLSFIGGNINDQEVVGHFLRNRINPLLTEFNVAILFIHHTAKPPKRDGTPSKAFHSDLFYLGAGSAELTNWARTTIALLPTENPKVFNLHAGKSGGALKWLDTAGKPTYVRPISHSGDSEKLYWTDLNPAEKAVAEVKAVKSETGFFITLRNILMAEGGEMEFKELKKRLHQATGIGMTTVRRRIEDALDLDIIKKKEPFVKQSYCVVLTDEGKSYGENV